MDEAVAWVKPWPIAGSDVELRKILDVDDFDPSFAATLTSNEAERCPRARPGGGA
ncbi:hypothetical protein [Occultella kanbiaonis]|uniref:hypothetical protein n=1 Tax=Occultella kanbiaonis TaxID=2675754 RepID=UPI0013D17D9E|nr:hypothetical protein [Occultella kanbiaonis]